MVSSTSEGPGSVTSIRILVVDDHPIVRDGIRGLFAGDNEFEVVGEAGDGADAVRQTAQLDPDVVLMDLRMPTMSGVEAIQQLRELRHPARVLVLTTYDTDRDVLPAVVAGATGYLLKDAPRDELIRAVRAAHAGQSVLSPAVAGTLMERVGDHNLALSPRELEVLRLVAGGATNRAVARQLFVSEATVKTHLLHLYDKLGVRDRAVSVAVTNRREGRPTNEDSWAERTGLGPVDLVVQDAGAFAAADREAHNPGLFIEFEAKGDSASQLPWTS